MSDLDPGRSRGEVEPGIFLLPFALPEPIEGLEVEGEVLARRLPDLLHQLLNAGGRGPAGMLEVQSPPDDGPPRWVTLSDVPSADEVFTMLGGNNSMRALVAGSMRRSDRGLAVDLAIHFAKHAPGGVAVPDGFAHGVHAVVRLEDPAPSVLRLAEHLAHALGLPFRAAGERLLTADPTALFRFLVGLDGAALLGGDPELESERPGEELLVPFRDALRRDPAFGLALRAFADSLFPALMGDRVSEAVCQRLLDEVLACRPTDGLGCVAIAEQLAVVGDETRSRAWLEHAVSLDAPPARAIESLGVQLANAGDVERARTLWRRGIEVDGHPDFFAHLARLAFNGGNDADARELMLRGLWRKLERTRRAAEWDEEAGGSVLLRYLSEHLEEGQLTEDLVNAIEDLAGEITDPVEQVDLGLCLREIGRDDLAEEELRAAAAADLPPSVEDRAVRALLGIEVPDFERRFTAASERAARGRDPRSALIEMQACLERRPEFWPALFYAGVALRRLGHQDEALDLMNEVVQRRPGQPEALVEMAEMFDARGNPKRALECVDSALALDPEDSDLHVLRAQYLEHLGRAHEAGAELERAIALEGPPRKKRRQR